MDFVKRVASLWRTEHLDIALAEMADRFRRQRHFAHRLEDEFASLPARALGRRMEAADRFERVSEEVEAKRLVGSRDEDVQDAAPHGVFAHFAHCRYPLEAVIGKPAR